MDNLTKGDIQDKVLKYETFINDVLKEDLKLVHENLDKTNSEIAEWVQLRTILNSLKETELKKGFKTKTDIGTNVYVQAHIEDASKILVAIGSGIYVEYSIEEALTFLDKRITLLNKQAAIMQGDSAKIKSRIKLVLHGIQELSNIK